jgi:hypothetical protein
MQYPAGPISASFTSHCNFSTQSHRSSVDTLHGGAVSGETRGDQLRMQLEPLTYVRRVLSQRKEVDSAHTDKLHCIRSTPRRTSLHIPQIMTNQSTNVAPRDVQKKSSTISQSFTIRSSPGTSHVKTLDRITIKTHSSSFLNSSRNMPSRGNIHIVWHPPTSASFKNRFFPDDTAISSSPFITHLHC